MMQGHFLKNLSLAKVIIWFVTHNFTLLYVLEDRYDTEQKEIADFGKIYFLKQNRINKIQGSCESRLLNQNNESDWRTT